MFLFKGTAPFTAFPPLRLYANYLVEQLLHCVHGYDAFVDRSLRFLTEADFSLLMFLEVQEGQTGANVNHCPHPTPY